MTANKPFAEIVESSLHGFTGQSWEWNQFPPFGSLVRVQTKKRTIFGIIYQIQTGSMDPMRYPFPYKKTEEELMAEQPQIFEFLRTTFSCLTIGYEEKGSMRYQLSPEPPQIHAFIEPVPQDLAKQFLYNEKYLHVLFGFAHQVGNIDELLLALLDQQAKCAEISPEKLNKFIETFSLLTGNDYRRLKLFLQRAEHIVNQQAI